MSELVTVVGLALLPALGNFAGGLLAEFRRPSQRNLNRALHFAAGIVLAVVAVELLPRALQNISGWLIGVLFGLGGLTYLGVQWRVERWQASRSGHADRTGMWMVYFAVAVDLFSDGLLIGIGASVSTSLALLLALGQLLADAPEGFSAIANMREKGVPRSRRMLLSAAFAIPVLAAAMGAYYLLRDRNEAVQLGGLVFVAGLLTVAAVEDMLGEAHESADDTWSSTAAMVGGFVLFTLVSAGMGDG
ncbi:MAG: peptidoglycan-binding protein [Xanthomonadales bacterium]|nr:peptidoglycan-binding protein [Xanthomonadales bacterium]